VLEEVCTLRICPQCGQGPLSFIRKKANGERELSCNQCGYKKWFTEEELSEQEKSEIEGIIEAIKKEYAAKQLVVRMVDTPHAAGKPKHPPVLKTNLEETSTADTLFREALSVFRFKLRTVLPQYVERPGQLELTRQVCTALAKGRIILTEAGVGTGKTFAYLVPLAVDRLNGPVVISTKTINLQEQLSEKDVLAIRRITELPEALLVKGQSHYLCRLRYSEFKKKPFKGASQEFLDELEEWMHATRTGDRAENGAPAVPDEVWSQINVDDCVNQSCEMSPACAFLHQKNLRKAWRGLIICNHNLLVDDLLLRAQGKAGLWPTPTAIVVDEAHGLADACRQELSQDIHPDRLKGLITKTLRHRKMEHAIPDHLLKTVSRAVENFKMKVSLFLSPELLANEDVSAVLVPESPELLGAGKALVTALDGFVSKADLTVARLNLPEQEERFIERRLNRLNRLCDRVARWVEDPDGYYLSASRTNRSQGDFALAIVPVNVGDFLARNLWSRPPVILTSGTLSVSGNFERVKDILGLAGKPNIQECIAPIGLEIQDSVAHYLPTDLREAAGKAHSFKGGMKGGLSIRQIASF
jgi:ATP-dependent DNA helicase DinG